MKIAKAPSISLGVMHEGKAIFRKSIGLRDVESNLEANSDTSYLIGSCSKMFTATALGVLVADKKLSWDDTISKHLPSFNPIEDPRIGQEATIIDACRHSTGLANPNVVYMGPEDTLSNAEEDHIAMLNALPTSNGSGQRFRSWWYYSNAAFGVLSLVIKAASGIRYSDFLRERLLEPLGLSQTLVHEADVDANNNIAHPYVQLADGKWSRIKTCMPSEKHAPTLASAGIRCSVNDLLVFLAAVMSQHDIKKRVDPPQPLLPQTVQNPLRQIIPMWNWWWSRPMEDGYPNDTVYGLGWYRTTMPSGAVGLTSYNFHRYADDSKSWVKQIIGQESTPRTLYGHNGIANGSVASAYAFPASHTAVVVLSNAADAGDAAETTAQVLLQALFELKPHINLISSISEERDRCLKVHENMINDWRRDRDVSKYTSSADDFLGSYIGLNTSRISIVPSGTAPAKLSVMFNDNCGSKCDLEPYNTDALSFLPLEHDKLLARGMIDWDYYKVGILEFVRDDGLVVGLWWQWDQYDYPGLWVRVGEGSEEEQMKRVTEKFGRFRKSQASKVDTARMDSS